MRLALRTANNHAVIDVTDQQSPGTASHMHICRFAGAVHIGRFTNGLRQNAVLAGCRYVITVSDLAGFINHGQH